MRRTTTFAMLASALMLLSVAAPAMASDVDDGSLSVDVSGSTVSVTGTYNNSSVAVEGATVDVVSTDANTSYGGTYTTGPNGTVSLPAPNGTVNVSVTASYENQTATTTATLGSSSDGNESGNESDEEATAFGQRVSSFVAMLQSNSTGNSSGNSTLLAQADDAKNMGVVVATFVTANNPGNAPDHAGPPAWLLDDSIEKTNGPPAHATGADNGSAGPPDDRGNGNGGGPPDDVGPNKDNGGGPPDHAGGPDDEDDE